MQRKITTYNIKLTLYNIKKLLILGFVLACFTGQIRAQFRRSQAEIGLMIGGMNYIGDLNNQSMLGRLRPAIGGLFRYNLGQRWVLQFSGAYGQIEGGNPDVIRNRNLSFRSSIIEGSIQIQFNFLPFGFGHGGYRWTPYLFCGFGFFGFNPKTQYTDPITGVTDWYELQPLGTEGQGNPKYSERMPYSLVEKMIPFGLGIKWKPTQYFSLGVEYGFRKTWTDYLDDVSTTYVEQEVLIENGGKIAGVLSDRTNEIISGYINPAGLKRGDDSLNDWFAFFGITATVQLDAIFSFLGWGPKCDVKR